MAPSGRPQKKSAEGTRKKAAPAQTPSSAKRTTRVKAAQPPKAVAISAGGATAANGIVLSEDAVRLSAYFKWVVAGRPEGDGVNFWLDAERELQGSSP